jgi:hypothetical protein
LPQADFAFAAAHRYLYVMELSDVCSRSHPPVRNSSR